MHNSPVTRRTVLAASAWGVPSIALAVAAPARAASGVTVAATPVALSAIAGEGVFPPLRIATSDGSPGGVSLSLSGTTFGNDATVAVRQLSAAGTLDVSDIRVPAEAGSGSLSASLQTDPGATVTVPLTTVLPGYVFSALVADQGIAYTSVKAIIDVAGETVPAGAQLTVRYDETSLTLENIETTPGSQAAWSSLGSPATTTLGAAVAPGRLIVTFSFGRVSEVAAEVSVTTALGEPPASGPATRSVITS